MNKEQKTKFNFSHTITLKGLIVAVMTILMLIPSFMIQGLIYERKSTRNEAVRKIDAKWSYAQTISGPILSVPFLRISWDKEGNKLTSEHVYHITPETLNVSTVLEPEERYYGIYKTILYKSRIVMDGEFLPIDPASLPEGEMLWERASLRFGLSDLRGISDNIKFKVNGNVYKVEASGRTDYLIDEELLVQLDNVAENMTVSFESQIDLKGSGSINFLPIGRTTSVSVEGEWPDPGFVGNYTPEYTLENGGFQASWKVLHFNRSLPNNWVDEIRFSGENISFGVNLVETVDIYQQNMRSAKYALMFIALTFVTFFFVEIISRKRIHPVQYLLVGVALILFYSLLLSISEPLGFGWAYLISSIATIGLIIGYSSTIFKNRKQTFVLAFILSLLYIFLYVILQLEQVALLAGSLGLFVILGVIMYFARKINWYSEDENA